MFFLTRWNVATELYDLDTILLHYVTNILQSTSIRYSTEHHIVTGSIKLENRSRLFLLAILRVWSIKTRENTLKLNCSKNISILFFCFLRNKFSQVTKTITVIWEMVNLKNNIIQWLNSVLWTVNSTPHTWMLHKKCITITKTSFENWVDSVVSLRCSWSY